MSLVAQCLRRSKALAETREFVFDPATQTGVGMDAGVTQAVSAASGVCNVRSGQLVAGQLVADQLAEWKLTKGKMKHASGLNNFRRDTERWLAPIKRHLQYVAAARRGKEYPGLGYKRVRDKPPKAQPTVAQ
ncbi:hypothetical protein QJQ45_009539 [Haematococcus lacustris]|nr:hypothetical protein QJQ45_009539 [Haematococcus lacustris]